ncbi:hypothetical protein ACLKA7_004883 [Drosophila subpalustris]
MRQRDDQPFASALNNMASGCMTADDIQLIRSRMCQPSDVPDDAIHLFYSNKEVDDYNTTKLNLIPTEQFYSTAEDVITGALLSPAQKRKSVKISVMDRMLKLSVDEVHSCVSKSRKASHMSLLKWVGISAKGSLLSVDVLTVNIDR